MADEPFALSTIPPVLPPDADYDAIYAAVMATMRGRWFLEEYARRNRHADTAKLLSAIARIEAVIREDHSPQTGQDMRAELTEMARAIAQTRADVAESRAPAPAETTPEPEATQPSVLAAAERLRDIAWTMRERDIEPSTCEQIEAIATTILSASALRDPHDSRAQRLGEVLHHLERRIGAMLERPAPTLREPTAIAVEEPAATDTMTPVGGGCAAPPPEPPASSSGFEQAAAELPAEIAEALSAEPQVPELRSELKVAESVEPDSTREENAEAEPQPVETHIERVELEIEPLVVVPVGIRVEEETASTIELAPIPVALHVTPPDPVVAEPGAAVTEQPAGASPPDVAPAAAGKPADVVATQVQSDLEALGAITIVAPGQASGREDTPVPEQERDVLADAWQISVTAGVPDPAPAMDPKAEQARVPSMWEAPAGPHSEPAAHIEKPETQPADLLSERTVQSDTAAAGHVPAPANRPVEIEGELFDTAARPSVAPADPLPTRAASAVVSSPPVAQAEPMPAVASIMQPQPEHTAPNPTPRRVGDDPLAALKAMTDEERIALFT
ncbi:MAG: hypothetical protein ACRECO_21140 [Xanthobacteraceae bacterium]